MNNFPASCLYCSITHHISCHFQYRFFCLSNCFTPSALPCHHCFLTNDFIPSSSISYYSKHIQAPQISQALALAFLQWTMFLLLPQPNHSLQLKIHPLTDNSQQVASQSKTTSLRKKINKILSSESITVPDLIKKFCHSSAIDQLEKLCG